MPDPVFADRRQAGIVLGERLARSGLGPPGTDGLVLGIPRGGVVVAAAVADVLALPFRAVLARKIGAPGQPELALGALGPDGTARVDETLARRAGATAEWLAAVVAEERAVLAARRARLPAVVEAEEVAGTNAIVVDDGVATGATAAAVGLWLRDAGASRRILALPVGPRATLDQLADVYDDVVVLSTPALFFSVGSWYRDFGQTTDAEVVELLARSSPDS